MKKIEFSRHCIDDKDIERASAGLRSIFLTTGTEVGEFEQKFAAYTGQSHAIGLISCTAALHLSLIALKIGTGDEVITTPMSFCATSKDRRSVYLGYNHSFARAVGHEHPASVVGTTDYDLTPGRADAYHSDDREVMESKTPKRHILEFVTHPDGRELWVDTTNVPLVDNRGDVYGVLGVYDDITERKRFEEALKESQERAQRLASAAFEGLGFSEGGRITGVNEKLASMLVYSVEENIGKPVMDFVAPESHPTVMDRIQSRERIRQIEAKALRKLRHPSRSTRLKSFMES